jgi:FkbM family methyltransferase
VIAFEPNPENYAAICADPRSSEIEVRAEAVSDEDGQATFYLLDVPPDRQWVKGASSLNRRGAIIQWGLTERPIRVAACRLDTVLQDAPAPIALWIDVEGAAKRVVDGFEGIGDRVSFIYVEVEPRPLWEGQAGASEVLDKLTARGFREVARDGASEIQFNVLLTRDVGPAALMLAKLVAAMARPARAAQRRLRTRATRVPSPAQGRAA